MKRIARKICFWPNISNDIVSYVNCCVSCRLHADSPPKQFQLWPTPQSAWERIHIDFAGIFKGYYWLLVIDALSKYPYIVRLTDITSKTTIHALDHIFAIEGCPRILVSDNGPQLTSSELSKYLYQCNIKHITTPPYHPSSNGQAERFVRTFKKSISKLLYDGLNLNEALITFLKTYRFTLGLDGLTPAEKLHGKRTNGRLTNQALTQNGSDLLFPNQKVYFKY